MTNQAKTLLQPDWLEIMSHLRGFQAGQIILSAHELGLFDHLGEESLTPEGIAQRLGASLRGITILLDALATLGLVIKKENGYQNSQVARDHLCQQGAHYRGGTLDHFLGMIDSWRQLPTAVRTGTRSGPREKSVIGDRRKNRSFIAAMAEMGRENGRILATNVDFSGRKRLLDLGGGPGAYASEILQKNPEMTAVVVDLPITIDTARDFVAKDPVGQRITLKKADFFSSEKPDLGEGYDTALISNVLHVEGETENRSLLKRVHDAMLPGGMLLIHEALIEAERTHPPDRALFAINMLVHTERGNCYTFAEIQAWMVAAGFEKIEMIDCFKQPSLMVGYRR